MMRTFTMFAALFLFTFSVFAGAAEIVKIKGASALIELKGDAAAPGDQFYATSDGKRRAILQITKVKGDKAIGHISKGKAQVGMTLEPRVASAGHRAGGGHSASGLTGKMFWGGMVGFAQDSANVKVLWQLPAANVGDTKEVASLNGTGYSALGLFDYGFTPNFWVRGLAGLESFNITGSSVCGTGNKSTCDAKINYVSASATARWLFMTGNYRPWAGLGLGVMFPMTKSSTAFDAASISSTQVILFEGGLDWQINSRMYVPISLEYGLLPKSTQVEAHWVELRVGLAVPF
jgi:outer membrane protein W